MALRHLESEQRFSQLAEKVCPHIPFLKNFPSGGDKEIPITEGISVQTGRVTHTITLLEPLTQEEADAVIAHNVAHTHGYHHKDILRTNRNLRPELQKSHRPQKIK